MTRYTDEELKQFLGRAYKPDERDKDYPLGEAVSSSAEDQHYRYWWASGWWGNQGQTPQCVAYAWIHWLEDGPVTHFYENRKFDPWYLSEGNKDKHTSLFKPSRIYETCQKKDRWPGEDYAGTSVRAGAKTLKELGVVTEYRWAQNIDDVVNCLMTTGPMVVGTYWHRDMFWPSKDGVIKPTGDKVGGHAYVLNGVNKKTGYLRIKNSWGRGWGKQGYAYISLEDFEKLLNDYGEACIAFEKPLKQG